MARLIIRYSILVSLLVGAGCVKKAPTSPPFEYAGEWRGTLHDYTIWYANTGNPLGSTLVLKVEKDGSASASGNFKQTIEGTIYSEQIKMTLIVLPDGLVSGTGDWGGNFGGRTFGDVGEVIGQLDAESDTGSGVLLVEHNEHIWHLPWEVTRSK